MFLIFILLVFRINKKKKNNLTKYNVMKLINIQ
jgi:hypothetical protein